MRCLEKAGSATTLGTERSFGHDCGKMRREKIGVSQRARCCPDKKDEWTAQYKRRINMETIARLSDHPVEQTPRRGDSLIDPPC